VPSDNEEVGKLLDVFSKISHKGEKINLDYGTVSLKSLLPSNIIKMNLTFRIIFFQRIWKIIIHMMVH
jgi:hypothetical protein